MLKKLRVSQSILTSTKHNQFYPDEGCCLPGVVSLRNAMDPHDQLARGMDEELKDRVQVSEGAATDDVKVQLLLKVTAI